MGRQVRFYATREDSDQLWSAIRLKAAQATLFEDLAASDGNLVEIDAPSKSSRWKVLIADQRDSSRIAWRSSVRGGRVDLFSSPVVEFVRSVERPGCISQGRLYYIVSYYDTNDRLVKKPDNFVRFAEQMFRTTKRLFERSSIIDGYVGNEAAKILASVPDRSISSDGTIQWKA